MGIILTIPRVIVKKGIILIERERERERENKKAWLRLDLYPNIAPKHMRRHFGFIDIPIVELKHPQTEIEFDGCSFVIDGQKRRLQNGFAEDGEIVLHASLWEEDSNHEWRMVKMLETNRFYWFKDKIHTTFKYSTITTSEICNLKCTMCGRQVNEDIESMRRLKARRFLLSKNQAKELAYRYKDLRTVLLLGSGEPLLNPDICEIVRIFRKSMGADAELNLGTNGTLLDAGMRSKLADSGLSGLGFSVDGATAATYEAIRIGASFKKVVENITAMTELDAARQTKIHFWCNFVVQPGNISECVQFVELCDKMGVKDCRFSLIQYYSTDEKIPDYSDLFGKDIGRDGGIYFYNEIRQQTMERALQLGIACSFDTIPSLPEEKRYCDDTSTKNVMDNSNMFCPFTEYLGFDENGDVNVLCCNFYLQPSNQDKYTIDPWENLRKDLMYGKFEGICKNCHMRIPGKHVYSN